MERWIGQVIEGDCLKVMRDIPDECVDSIVTDPPAGIGFMGKEWDKNKGGRDKWIEWMAEIAREALRVIKPGGHALVWSLPRTSHWTATAWENGGWEELGIDLIGLTMDYRHRRLSSGKFMDKIAELCQILYREGQAAMKNDKVLSGQDMYMTPEECANKHHGSWWCCTAKYPNHDPDCPNYGMED